MSLISRGHGRIYRNVVAILATAFVASCDKGATPTPTHKPDATAQVFRAVLDMIAASDTAAGELVIQRETEPPVSLLDAPGETPAGRFADIHRQRLAGLLEQTEEAFWNSNRESAEIDNQMVARKPVRLLSRADFNEKVLRAPNGWETFFAQNPHSGGVVRLSRVGFGEDGDQALVYYSRACPFCARSEYVLLQRQDTVWKVVARSLDTVS